MTNITKIPSVWLIELPGDEKTCHRWINLARVDQFYIDFEGDIEIWTVHGVLTLNRDSVQAKTFLQALKEAPGKHLA